VAARRTKAAVVLPKPPTVRSTSVRPRYVPPQPSAPSLPPIEEEKPPEDAESVIRTYLDRKDLHEGLDYWFEYGLVRLPARSLAWRYSPPDDRGEALMGRLILEGQGIIVVDLNKERLVQSPQFVLNEAWEGREV